MTKRNRPFSVVDTGQPNRADEIARAASELVALRFMEEYQLHKGHCESPIEELLLAALMSAGTTLGNTNVIFMGRHSISDRFIQQETVYIHQQAEVGKYRTDFLFHDCSVPFEISKPRLMAVECDGHDFHEKTKEQARRDKQRDRYFQSIGVKVLRFTGSEIWQDPDKCAEEIFGELACDDGSRTRDR